MQEKVVLDTNVYIGIFNKGLFKGEVDAFSKVMYLAHPVLHELWMGAREKAEIRHLINFGNKFVKLNRLIRLENATQILIGQVCQKLRASGRLDPRQPRIYNDVCVALLARQIGATVVTVNIADFKYIQKVIDFKVRRAIVK